RRAFTIPLTLSRSRRNRLAWRESRLRVLSQDGTTWDLQIDREFAERRKHPASQNGTSAPRNLQDLFSEVILSGNIVISNDALCQPYRALSAGDVPLEAFLGVPIF